MKQTIILLLPLLIVGCAKNTPDLEMFKTTVMPAKLAPARENTFTVDVPVRQRTKIEIMHVLPYTKSVEIIDGKKTKEEVANIKYGTTVVAEITPLSDKRVVNLDIELTCPPSIKTFTTPEDRSVKIDLPNVRMSTAAKEIVINKGESIRLSGMKFDSDCAVQDIIIHPVE